MSLDIEGVYLPMQAVSSPGLQSVQKESTVGYAQQKHLSSKAGRWTRVDPDGQTQRVYIETARDSRLGYAISFQRDDLCVQPRSFSPVLLGKTAIFAQRANKNAYI